MREIKFRAWDRARNTWLHPAKTPDMAVYLYGETIRFGELWRRPDGTMVPLGEMHEILWMQFTGRKDSNGVEAYEGDIVQRRDGKRGEIVWQQEMCGFGIAFSDDEPGSLSSWFEVVGNKYETPKLLTPTNK